MARASALALNEKRWKEFVTCEKWLALLKLIAVGFKYLVY